MSSLRPLVWLDIVGLTPRLLDYAPNLKGLASAGCTAPLEGVVPAVTCAAQASALTGLSPSGHGIVGNGWLHRETGEVRFWLQSNALIQGETIYAAGRRLANKQGKHFTSAKLFWWFNEGAEVDWSVTPKPWYGADGSKVFGIHGNPGGFAPGLERVLGAFPFHAFWGPLSGLKSSEWIARAAALTLREKKPSFTMVYLPHLDYDLQRFGPDAPGTPERVAEVDRCAGMVIDAAREIGAEVVAFSEYGLMPVQRAAYPNRILRQAGLLEVRDGPFGELIDVFRSRAVAVCDHQVAHVYLKDPTDHERVSKLLRGAQGVWRALNRDARVSLGLEHPRVGDIVLLARPDAWFAYPYWLDDRRAPDFARTVDIHRKPGYDPCELFLDPDIRFPKLRVARRLARKKLGMRYLMDVVPLDASMVRGSHGVLPTDPRDGPILVADDPNASERVKTLMDLKQYSLERIGLEWHVHTR